MRFSGRKERNGGAARSANLGGCKGQAANGGEGKSGRGGRREGGGREKSGRYYRPEKEERSEARGQGEGIERRTKGKERSGRYYRPEKEERSEAGTKGKESRVKKGIADSIGIKNIKLHFIGRKTPENLHMCKKKCNFARFLWAKDELVDEINN